MTQQPEFILYLNKDANPANLCPHLVGTYRLTHDEVDVTTLAFWAAFCPNGHFNAAGIATGPNPIEWLEAAINDNSDPHGPHGLALRIGEAALFHDAAANPENKKPNFFGYAREPHRFVSFAGWERGNTIIGTANIFVPDPEPAPSGKHAADAPVGDPISG